MQKLTRRLLIAGLALVALAVILPLGAKAQAATLQLTQPAAPPVIKVDGSQQVTIPWTYTFSTVATPAVGQVSTTAVLTWDQPTCTPSRGMSVVGSLTEIITFQTGSTSNSVKGSTPFTIVASSLAPGEQAITCNFGAQVASVGTAVQASNKAGTSVTATVAYRGLITATVPLTIQQAGPQKQISYTMSIQNLGNSDSAVNFALVGGVPSGWQAILPAQVILTTPNNGGTDNSKEVSFVISTPYKNGWNNKEQTFQLTVVPQSTKDNTDNGKGAPITVNVLARDRGIYVPGPEPALVLVGALGAVVVARRLQRA